MATLTRVYSFVEALAEKVHNLGSDVLKIALCNEANPPIESNTQLSDLTVISYTNLSTRTITRTSSSQTDGVYTLVLQNLTLTATGDVAPWRYFVIYNDTATNDELIGYGDYGSEITLHNGESVLLDFNVDSGILTLGGSPA